MKNFTKLILLMMILSLSAGPMYGQRGKQKQKSPPDPKIENMTQEELIAYEKEVLQPKAEQEAGENLEYEGPEMNRGSSRAVVIFEEYFDEDIPDYWTQKQWGGTGEWEWTDSPGYPFYYYPPPYSDDKFAQAYDYFDYYTDYDVGLFTPALNLTGATFMDITWDDSYYGYSFYGNAAGVYVYSGGMDASNLETTLIYYTYSNYGDHRSYTIDPTTFDDPSEVYIEYWYTDGYYYGYGYCVDNVVIEADVPTGDVEGYVMDFSTGAGIENVLVELKGGSDVTDADGYYYIDEIIAGTYDITATYQDPPPPYSPQTKSVTIEENVTTQCDFYLGVPVMLASPLSFDVVVNPNEYYETPLSIINIGTGGLWWNAVIFYLTDRIEGSYPKYNLATPEGTFGEEPDELAVSREGADDQVTYRGIKDVGDVLNEWPAPISFAWGIAHDRSEYIWLSDPYDLSDIHEVDPEDGTLTGNTLPIGSWVGSWCGDMASDGTYIYCCNVGGDNEIKVIDIENGDLIESIGGEFSYTSQRGLAYDQHNNEFYIGGWNSDQIWRVDNTGATISSTSFAGGVSGLAWHPEGGPDKEGSLWVAENSPSDLITEIDPNNGWTTYQSFSLPNSTGYGGAGAALDANGTIWLPNQNNNVVYNCDLEQPLTPGPSYTDWLTLDFYEGYVPPFSGTQHVGVNFDAGGIPSGTTLYANIVLNSSPDVGSITIPVTMTVMGDSLGMVDDLEVEILNTISGYTKVTWKGVDDKAEFLHYVVKRNDTVSGTTLQTQFFEYLPYYGEHCYTVQAVYDQGNTSPAGPECVNWYLPEADITPTFLSAEVLEGEKVEVEELIEIRNTGMPGSILSFTFSYDPEEGFIYEVIPDFGYVDEGDVELVRVIYSAEDYTEGVYTQELPINTNDPYTPQVIIDNQMTVLEPAMFTGRVTDGNTEFPLKGVTVTADGFAAETDDNGEYELMVEGDMTYDITYSKLAYQDITVPGIYIDEGETVTIDTVLYENPYPPQSVTATVNEEDTECLVEWTDVAGPYEIAYDDGNMEEMYVSQNAHERNAVKFTPDGYPATVTGGRVYIGDGFFPEGAELLGTTFGMEVYDDDGAGGMPGTKLDSIEVMVLNFNWVEFDGLNANISDGDFYIAMVQGDDPPNTAGIGIDDENPVSWRSYMQRVGGEWELSIYQDYMLRAHVDGIVYLNSDGDRKMEYGRLWRFSNFDPDDPGDLGEYTFIKNDWNYSHNDTDFENLDMGWYKYGVTAVFTNGDTSEFAISNIVGHLMLRNVTFNVSTTDGASPEGAVLKFTGDEYPYETFTGTVPEDGVLTFEVWRGVYHVDVFLEGYERYIQGDMVVYTDMEYNIVLKEKTFPPRNLYVDPLTSIATWWSPVIPPRFLSEDFEGGTMPPGWTTTSEGNSEWYVTEDGSSTGFNIPPHTYYAVCNDEAAGSTNEGCCDYLITPVVDIRDYSDYILRFQSYFTGEGNDFWGTNWQSAYVEYSIDAGENWELIETMVPANEWVDVVVDMSGVCGPTAPAYSWIGFHADDNGDTGSGWAVDDVTLAPASSNVDNADSLMGYQVFLDDAFVAYTADTTYQYIYLTYGQTYVAGVAAQYSSGLSEMITYKFTSEFLLPPRNLEGEGGDNEDYAYLTWQAPIVPITPPSVPAFTGEIEHTPPDAGLAPIEPSTVPEREKEGLNYRGSVAFGMDAVTENGFLDFDIEDLPGYTFIGPNAAPDFISGMAFPVDEEDWAYGVVYGMTSLYQIDRESGSVTLVGSLSGATGWNDITIDPTDETYYATGDDNLYSFNPKTLEATLIGAHGGSSLMIGIACDENGDLWGYDLGNDMFYSIDKTTGAATSIGGIGFNANYAQCMFYDQATKKVIMGAFNGANFYAEIREVDVSTGGSTILSSLYYYEITGCAIPIEGGGQGGEIPDNVLSYNLYRDSKFVDNIDHIEDQMNYEYYDFDLPPGVYLYTVTAVYDLTKYGFPGETGESMEEGPVEVQVSYGWPLPFLEEWDYGNFGANQWTTGCDNWWVNTNEGNPEPSAEFTWDPLMYNYRCGLWTYPLLGSEIIDGEIWVDFDIKLESRNNTAKEYMKLAVWTYAGDTSYIEDFVNDTSFDWTSHHIEITDKAKGHDFRVGFIAQGDSSINLYGWFVDNIHIYRVCPAPLQVETDYDDAHPEEGVEITWIAPGTTVGEWFGYNDGSFEGAICSTNGGAGLAQLLTPEEYPVTITKVRYFNDSYEQYQQQEEIYVLTGDGETILAGPYYVNNGPADDWVEVIIDPVTISEGSFMVATFNTDPDGPFIGYDDSFYNGTLYFGSIGDFVELSEYDYYVVGSHEAYLETEIGDNIVLNSQNSAPVPEENSKYDESDISLGDGGIPAGGSRDLLGFNIYRSIDEGEWEMINDSLVPESPYVDENLPMDCVYYCYYVTAVYDQCESDSSNTSCEWILFPGIDELNAGNISIYPNPANELVNIESDYDIKRVRIVNYIGQYVYEKKVVEENHMQINTSGYDNGVYFIEVETTEGLLTKKFTIAR